MRNTGKTLLGLAGLFAVGAIVGALYAPDKGERTRRRIARNGRWIFHTATDAIEEGKDNLQALRDRIKDDLEKVDEEIDRLSRCRTNA